MPKRLRVVLWLLLLVGLALVWGVEVALACRWHYVRAVLLRCQVLIALFLDQIEWPLLWRHLRIGPVFAHLLFSLLNLHLLLGLALDLGIHRNRALEHHLHVTGGRIRESVFASLLVHLLTIGWHSVLFLHAVWFVVAELKESCVRTQIELIGLQVIFLVVTVVSSSSHFLILTNPDIDLIIFVLW